MSFNPNIDNIEPTLLPRNIREPISPSREDTVISESELEIQNSDISLIANKDTGMLVNPSNDHGPENSHDESIEGYPEGFPRLTAFLNSTDDFAIVRRFGKLHMRMLVQLQVELTLLEAELDALDKNDTGSNFEYRLRSVEHDDSWDQTRKELELKIIDKLHQYDTFLLHDRKLRMLPRPTVDNYRSVFDWIRNNKPLDLGELDFIYKKDDFVSYAKHLTDSNSTIDVTCDDYQKEPYIVQSSTQANVLGNDAPESSSEGLIKADGPAKVILTEDQTPKSVTTGHLSQQNTNFLTQLVSSILGTSVLMGPVSVLLLIQMSTAVTLIAIFISSVAFSASLYAFTNSTRQEVFLGTAAYCVVITAFLGNYTRNGIANTN